MRHQRMKKSFLVRSLRLSSLMTRVVHSVSRSPEARSCQDKFLKS